MSSFRLLCAALLLALGFATAQPALPNPPPAAGRAISRRMRTLIW